MFLSRGQYVLITGSKKRLLFFSFGFINPSSEGVILCASKYGVKQTPMAHW